MVLVSVIIVQEDMYKEEWWFQGGTYRRFMLPLSWLLQPRWPPVFVVRCNTTDTRSRSRSIGQH